LAIGCRCEELRRIATRAAFRIEVWDDEVVLLRELDDTCRCWISLGRNHGSRRGCCDLTLELAPEQRTRHRAIPRKAKTARQSSRSLPTITPNVQPGRAVQAISPASQSGFVTVMLVNGNPMKSSRAARAKRFFFSDGAIGQEPGTVSADGRLVVY